MNDSRFLFVCWQDPIGRGIYPVGRLEKTERLGSSLRYEFRYLVGAIEAGADHGFEPFLSFPFLEYPYKSQGLFPFFQNLVMSRKRNDFPDYLKCLGLDRGGDEPVDPFTIISRDRGGGASESLEVFGPPERDEETRALTYHFLARGVRHVKDTEEAIQDLREGDSLILEVDPQNAADPCAVKLLSGKSRRQVGYVPFYLSEDLGALLAANNKPNVVAEKINRPPAPTYHRLLCRMDVLPHKGFEPFSTRRFDPIRPADLKQDVPPVASARPD